MTDFELENLQGDRRHLADMLPPGWHYDEDTGAIMRDVIHRMGRRCHNWDYSGRATYLITLVLADRTKPLLGTLAGDAPDEAAIALSPPPPLARWHSSARKTFLYFILDGQGKI